MCLGHSYEERHSFKNGFVQCRFHVDLGPWNLISCWRWEHACSLQNVSQQVKMPNCNVPKMLIVGCHTPLRIGENLMSTCHPTADIKSLISARVELLAMADYMLMFS